MTVFSKLYDRAMTWALHRHAQWYLAGLSFAESSFFPVPPDVMLAPMCLANTKRAWHFAFITTVASVVGGVAGYIIGSYAFDVVEPLLASFGYIDRYKVAVDWFDRWGVWVVFLAGFTPIPYKLFTIAAGVVSMALLPFIIASFFGRGARFFMVAGFMVWGGSKMESILRQYIDRIGVGLVVVIAIGITVYYYLQ
jgi:membrane protein YqaA with SNARE-associated domain